MSQAITVRDLVNGGANRVVISEAGLPGPTGAIGPPGDLSQVTADARYGRISVSQNGLFVGSWGSDANDGLSWGAPKLTIAAALGSSRVIHLGPGTHNLAGALSAASLVDLAIVGPGADVALIAVNGNYNAFTFSGTCRGVTLRDFVISSGAVRTSGVGISVDSPTSTPSSGFVIENVRIQNMPTPLDLRSLHHSTFSNIFITQTMASATFNHLVYMLACNSIRFRDGRLYNGVVGQFGNDAFLLDSDCDTILISDTEARSAVGNGVRLINSVGGASTGPRLVRLRDVFIELCTLDGLAINAGRDFRASGGSLAANGQSGASIAGGSNITLREMLVTENQFWGMYLSSGVDQAALLDNYVSNNSQNVHDTYYGIFTDANVQHVRIRGNRSGNFWLPATPNKQKYGIGLGGGTSDYLIVTDNDLQGNVTAGLLNSSTGANNKIDNNAV